MKCTVWLHALLPKMFFVFKLLVFLCQIHLLIPSKGRYFHTTQESKKLVNSNWDANLLYFFLSKYMHIVPGTNHTYLDANSAPQVGWLEISLFLWKDYFAQIDCYHLRDILVKKWPAKINEVFLTTLQFGLNHSFPCYYADELHATFSHNYYL